MGAARADEALGYVYLPVETPTGDFYGGHRLGDNLFGDTSSASTRRRASASGTSRSSTTTSGTGSRRRRRSCRRHGRRQAIKAVALVTKQAFTYVFDRATGAPVWPIEERPVPQRRARRADRQRRSRFPPSRRPFDRQGVTVDDLIDFTPEIRARAIEVLRGYRLGAMYQPPSLAVAPDGTSGTILLPGVQGGAQWEHGAADPETGLLYVSSATQPSLVALEKSDESDMDFVAAARGAVPTVDGLPIVKPPYGRITALDLKAGEIAWQVANGDTPPAIRDHPLLKGVPLPRTGSRSRAGLLATKTLLFAGEGWGGQPWFRALDKATGATVWETAIPAVQTGPPMTYLHQGRQYIVFTVGDQERGIPARLIAFALSAPAG